MLLVNKQAQVKYRTDNYIAVSHIQLACDNKFIFK